MEGPSTRTRRSDCAAAVSVGALQRVVAIGRRTMKDYRHTQRAGRWLIIPLVASVGLLVAAWLTGIWSLLAGVAVLGIAACVFSSLTIEVRSGELRWRYGLGLLHRRVSLAEVADVRPVRTTLMEGWGIHYTRFGWLYNIAGFGAVAVRLRNGREFAVGTDDPAGLVTALAPTSNVT